MSENLRLQLERLPTLLAPHLWLTIVALLAGIAISIPLGLMAASRKAMQFPTLASASVVQTIPSLALLALMVPLLEMTGGLGVGLEPFGFWPAVIALTMYSVLPILRNTVTGIAGVDPSLIEAARGVGMTRRQMLLRVQLPLALPVIIAGVRTATVWVVGIATLATPVGQRCLGNFIFAGLQTRNWTMVMVGVVAAAVLAIALDLLIAGMQRAAESRRPSMGLVVAAATVTFVGLGMASPRLLPATYRHTVAATDVDVAAEAADLGPIRIGAKTFTEQYVLASLIDQRLTAAGYRTRRIEGLGSTIVFDQLRNGSIDVYVDYSGTVWVNYMKRSGHVTAEQVLEAITWWLAKEHSIRCLGSLGFENAYALAMRRDRVEALGVHGIADLTPHAATMKIGGDYEFFGRPEWRTLRETYNLRFTQQMGFDSTLMYDAVAQGHVDVIAAFSSDGRLPAFDLIVLDDPQQAIPPYDAVLLVGPRVADSPGLIRALQRLIGAIDTPTMQKANMRVDIDGATPRRAAEELYQRVPQ